MTRTIRAVAVCSALAIALVLALAVAGCGSSDSDDNNKPVTLTNKSTCADWAQATPRERRRFARKSDVSPTNELTFLSNVCAGPITDPKSYGDPATMELGEFLSSLSGVGSLY